MPAPVQRPRANAVIGSSATLQDVFPEDIAFDVGLDKRAYAVCSRKSKDGAALEPEIIAIDRNGILHCFTAPEEPTGSWSVEQFALPELAGAAITHITANEQDPATGAPRLLVQICAVGANRRHVFLTVARTDKGFERFELPRSPIGPEMMGDVVATGVAGVGGGKLPTFYQCLRESDYGGISLNAYAFSQGESLILGLMDNPVGVDHLVTPAVDWTLGICRVTPRAVQLFTTRTDPKMIDYRNRILPISFGRSPSKTIPLPVLCDVKDASAILPVTDARSLCHGVFIITTEQELVACSFLSDVRADMTAVMTGHRDGPERAREVAYSFGENGEMHVYLSDQDEQIWYANWVLGARPDRLVWYPTGQTGSNLRAAQVIAGEPKLFATEGENDIVMLTRQSNNDEVWLSSSVVVPSDQQVAVACTVHAIEISAVTVQSDPVAGEPLEVYADRPCVAEYEGRLLRLGPSTPFRVETGLSGGLRLRLRADALEAPTIRVILADRREIPEARLHPQDGALQRLAGLDPRITIDGPRLQQMGLVPQSYSREHADQIAETIRQASLQSLRDGADRPEQRMRRLALRASGAGINASVSLMRASDGRVVVGEPHQDGRLRAVTATSKESSASRFWGWVQGAWNTVKRFVVEVVEGAVNFVVEAAGKTVEFLTKVGRYIEKGIQAVLAFVADTAEKLVEVGHKIAREIAALLGWEDVLAAKEGIKSYALASIDDIRYLVGHTARTVVAEGIARAKANVSDLFDRAIEVVGPEGALGPSAEKSTARARVQRHGAEINVINGSVGDTKTDKPLFELSPETRAKFDQVKERAANLPDNMRMGELLKGLADLFNGKSTLADAINIGLSTLLRTVKELILLTLDTTEALVNLVLDLISDLLGLFRAAIVKPLSELLGGMQWIDRVYGLISGGAKLTLIDLAALIFVTPGVLMAHIVDRRNVMDPKLKPDGDYQTSLRAIDGILDRAQAPVGGNEDAPTPISEAMKRCMNYIRPALDVCQALWYVIKGPLSILRNAARLTVIQVDPPIFPMNFLIIIMDLVERVIKIIDICDDLITYVASYLEELIKKNPLLVIVVATMAMLGAIAFYLSPILSWIKFRPIDKILIDALVDTALVWIPMTLYHIAMLIGISVTSDGKPDKQTSGYVTHALALFQSQQYAASLGIPIGGRMMNKPEPATATLGTVLVGLNIGADFVAPILCGVGLMTLYFTMTDA